MELRRRDRRLDNDLSEIADKYIDRVEVERILGRLAVPVYRIENRGQIGQKPEKDRPEILDIPEEHEQRREDHSDPDIEEHQANNRIQQENELPCEGDMVDHAEHKKHAQRQSKVDQRLNVFREQKQVLWHIDLGKDLGIAQQTTHPLVGGLTEIRKHEISAEEVGGIVGRIPSKELGKDQSHH